MRTFKPFAGFVIVLSAVLVSPQQRSKPASQTELSDITQRGRLLAEYDAAAWHATDAIQAARAVSGSFAHYIAKKTDSRWAVVFGRLNDRQDRFFVVYEAVQGARPEQFNVKRYDPPKEDSAFYLVAARAIDVVQRDFGRVNRPYNIAILPTDSNQIFVYVYPAQTVTGVYPLGGDVRYRVSEDGSKILEKRQLHKTILDFQDTSTEGRKIAAGTHTDIFDDVPEDTDVFYVLTRKPSVPEYVATRGEYFYEIEVDGKIKRVK